MPRLGPSVEQKETKQINSAMAGAMLGLGQGAEGGGIAQGPEQQGLRSAGAVIGCEDCKCKGPEAARSRLRGTWAVVREGGNTRGHILSVQDQGRLGQKFWMGKFGRDPW